MKKASPNEVLLALGAASADEESAILFFEAARWGNAPKCPHCASDDVYTMKDDADETKRERNYRWRCRACKERYSVRTGAIFEETRLPMRVWAHAMWRVCASKKGVSALQVSRETQVSYKSALFLLHRIRHAMADGGTFGPLGGDGKTVEVDETYVGGRPRSSRPGCQGHTDKRPVVAMVERGGNLRYSVMDRVTSDTLGAALAENVDQASRLMTDESKSYTLLGRTFLGGHGTTNHKRKQYAKPDGTHSNTAESAFSLLKRGLYGTFHSVSRHHLHRYCDEAAFKWNYRRVNDGLRVIAAIHAAEGKRLLYRRPEGHKAAG